MKRVAVIGGGPGGAQAAEVLARGGLEVMLFDEKLAWEKPCGGGVTFKAYQQYPFLSKNEVTKKHIQETTISTGATGVRLDLGRPILIYSRQELNRMLLRRAENAGAQLEQARVTGMERKDSGWRIATRQGSLEADYCVIATGARNPFRTLGTEFRPGDAMYALGYYVEGCQPHIDIQFFQGFQGYVWVFPRCGHLSVGIGGKGEPAQQMRARLERYMDRHGYPLKGAKFYAHMLPSLETSSWRKNRIAGDGWMAVGDAAGMVDPVTGEGIYYAMRSGDLAAQTILNDSVPLQEKAACYRGCIDQDFGRDLYIGTLLSRRIYLGNFLMGSIPARMVQFVRRSPRFRELMQDLFAGTQGYETLKQRLLASVRPTIAEVAWSFFSRRLLAPARS